LHFGKQIDNQVVNPNDLPEDFLDNSKSTNDSNPNVESNIEPNSESNPVPTQLDNPTEFRISFPHLLRPNKNSDQMDKFMETFQQVKVNIPLLDIIKQVPMYAKFLKDLCTQKRHTQVPKKVFLASGLSEVFVQIHASEIQRSWLSHNLLYDWGQNDQ